MDTRTTTSALPIAEKVEKQFLIVPVIFRHQIEALIRESPDRATFGFFYGVQLHNCRIIKKIWPIKDVEVDQYRTIRLSAGDFDRARQLTEGTNLTLLGCFYADGDLSNGDLTYSIEMESLSFVKVDCDRTKPLGWHSCFRLLPDDRVLEEKVLV